MTDPSNTDLVLIDANLAMQNGQDIYADKLNWRLHALAEAQDKKAKVFFVTMMASEDANWRLEGVRNVGYHYDLELDLPIVAKLRDLVITDPSEEVRMTAASVLGIRSVWPDRSLYRALTTDNNRFVKETAFRSLLDLAGLSYAEIKSIMGQVESGEISVTSAGLQSVLGERIFELQGEVDDSIE